MRKSNRLELMYVLPPIARKRLEEDKTKLVEANFKGNTEPKYTKLQYLRVYRGYDLLENFGFARLAVQRKHNIDVTLLEHILFLVPKNIFTIQDLRDISSIRYTYKKIDTLIRLGYVSRVTQGYNKEESLYKTTAKAREICQELHEVLAGEQPIPTDILTTKNASKSDLLKASIIKRLNEKETKKPRTTKVLWARKV